MIGHEGRKREKIIYSARLVFLDLIARGRRLLSRKHVHVLKKTHEFSQHSKCGKK